MFKKLIFSSILAVSSACALAGGAAIDLDEKDSQVAAEQLSKATVESTGNYRELAIVQAAALSRLVKQVNNLTEIAKGSPERAKLAKRLAEDADRIYQVDLADLPGIIGEKGKTQVIYDNPQATMISLLQILVQQNAMLLKLATTR